MTKTVFSPIKTELTNFQCLTDHKKAKYEKKK